MANRGSSANKKGKDFERLVANILKQKFGVEVRRTPSQERWKVRNQGDVNAMGESIVNRFHWEAKNHATVSIKEWYKKAKDDCGYSRIPVVVFRIPNTEHILTTLSLDDLCRVLVELDGYHKQEHE